jgi:hypothetical protein
MRITRRQIRQIIREAKEPMSPDYVYDSLMGKQDFGPRKGLTRMEMALDALAKGDNMAAVNHIEDALWIDDPPPGAEEELADLIAGVDNEDDLSGIASEWGTRHFRSH